MCGNLPLDFLLARVGARVLEPGGDHYVFQTLRITPYFFAIHGSCDVVTALANENPYPKLSFEHRDTSV
jgi:hypothetical protein